MREGAHEQVVDRQPTEISTPIRVLRGNSQGAEQPANLLPAQAVQIGNERRLEH